MTIYLCPYDWLVFSGLVVVCVSFLLMAIPGRAR
jgi:hypothetical protein